MSAAAANYTPTDLEFFDSTVSRAASLLYSRLERVRNKYATELDWICSQANNLYSRVKHYTNDHRLDDLLFTSAAARAKGETLSDTLRKLEDVSTDYTLTMNLPQLNRQQIRRTIWKFYVLRELYLLFVKQISKSEKNTGTEIIFPCEFLISVYALQKGLKLIGSYCSLHHSEQFIFN